MWYNVHVGKSKSKNLAHGRISTCTPVYQVNLSVLVFLVVVSRFALDFGWRVCYNVSGGDL